MASLACLAVGRLFGPGDLSEGCLSLLHMVSLSSAGLARGSSRGHLRILTSSMIGRVLMHKRFFKPLLAPYLRSHWPKQVTRPRLGSREDEKK